MRLSLEMDSNGTISDYLAPESDSGDAFTFNLLSDLGPLLSLFGEQFAKQFMSESFGWSDHILFAMAPLGIITAMVGAIRVSGPRWLNAVIGRARENRAIAEQELMSSASHEVCEMWNGQQLVRIPGAPEIRELIHIGRTNHNTDTGPATDYDDQGKNTEIFYALRHSDVFADGHLECDGKSYFISNTG